MAMIDDNSGIPTGAGKDPLAELDQELEQLKLTLGEMEQAPIESAPIQEQTGTEQAAPPLSPDEQPQAASVPALPPQPMPAQGNAAPAPADKKRPDPPRQAPKGPRTAIIIAALTLALVGIAAGLAVYFLNRQPAAPEPVIIHDSELGTVELQPVEGASVNSYDTDSLTMDDKGYYTYTVNGVKVSEMGVDLSEYQGDVDFEQVKASGIDFVMLRLGGRYYGDEGKLYSDAAFAEYYRQAKAAGLKVGAYFFSQAASKADAVEEANYSLALMDGLALDYPVAIDWETIDDDEARTDNVTGEELTAIASAFCDTIKAAGYHAAVYASTSLILQSYDFETMKDYDFWLADYRAFPEKEKMYYNFAMWQYSTTGAVPGIEGDVDMNVCLNASLW